MKEVFILGSGSSLTGFDFNRLNGKDTIGINYIFKFYEPTYLIWADGEVYDNCKDEINRLKSKKFCYEAGYREGCDAVLFKNSEEFYGKEGLKKGLYGGGLCSYISGIFAISLAIALGYERIYLLGYDGGRIKGRLHFHEFSWDRDLEDYNSKYDVFKDYDIVNCSLESKITQFPKKSIDEVLSE